MITWDESKRRLNLRKHGIDLAELEEVFDSHMATVEDGRVNYGEQRLASLGQWRGRVVFPVWTKRNESAHLISRRYAYRSEVQEYFSDQ